MIREAEIAEITPAGEMRAAIWTNVFWKTLHFAMDTVMGEVNVMGQSALENLKAALEGVETGNKELIRSVFDKEKS